MRAPHLAATLLTLTTIAALAGCADDDVNVIDNQPPIADAGAGGTVNAGAIFLFDGQASRDLDGSIVSFAWDFGDGATADGATAQHIYNAPGTFTAVLVVTDDKGATGSNQVIVTVIDDAAPVAVIDAPDSGVVAATLAFDGARSTDADGAIASWSWDFGDSHSATGVSASHAFAAPGAFVVTLTVTDDRGALGTAQHTVTIPDAPPDWSGTWNWFLVDPSQRTEPGLCGTFEDSTLTILATAPSISITEGAGSVSVQYDGTLTGADFATQHASFGVTQRITGTFTSPTAFTGVYALESSITNCADRAVTGVKVQ